MEEPNIVVVDSNRRNEREGASGLNYSGAHEAHFNGHLQNASNEEHLPNVYEVRRYKTIETVWATILSLTVEAIFLAVVLQLRWYCSTRPCVLSMSSISIYLNSAVWLFTFIIHRYICHQRNHLRRHGYAEFYHKTRLTSAIPVVVFSAGNVALLIYQTALHDVHCYESMGSQCKFGLDMFVWIQVLIGLEVLLSFPNLFIYLVHSLQFNKCRQTPDIFRESPLDQDSVSVRRDVGFRSQTLVEEVLERQSDAITYLKLRCGHLTRTIFNLTVQQSAHNSADDLHVSLTGSDSPLLVP